jgi:hypothetical protein
MIPIEIVALSLVSCQPITVTYNGGMSPEQWDVRVCLSSAGPQQMGSMTVRTSDCDCLEGGTFDSQLPILPKLVFTRTLPTPATMTLDFLSAGRAPIGLSITQGYWGRTNFFGEIEVPAGTLVDHDCDAGTADLGPLAGTSSFFWGIRTARCADDCSPEFSIIKRLSRLTGADGSVGLLAAAECLSPDSDADGLCDDVDNCVDDPNPGQADTDDDGVGDLCDNCPADVNFCQEDTDMDGTGDVCQQTGVPADPVRPGLLVGLPRPNPNRGSLSFSVSLEAASPARIRLFDVSGRALRALLDQTLESGPHSWQWDLASENLPAGLYYLRIDVAGESITRPFVLVR